MSDDVPPCPCSTRFLEDQGGVILWRPADDEWCGNPAQPFTTVGGQVKLDGWCEDCIVKACPHCRHD